MHLGRRAAYLRKCILAAELYMKFESEDAKRNHVFKKHIKPVLRCSIVSYNSMLNVINPEKELKEIQEQLKKEE